VPNIDAAVVSGFGEEWRRFDQSGLGSDEYNEMFSAYFRIFPWQILPKDAIGFDLGCGSGRWARAVAPQVGELHCIDASDAALSVAKENLKALSNVKYHLASVDHLPLDDHSMDFGYCLGVLHHVPDPWSGLRQAVSKLKKGAPFLLYVYYSFDNRPRWYSALWKATDGVRRLLSRLPFPARYVSSQVLATLIYFPLAKVASALDGLGLNVNSLPLSSYRHRSFYTMRRDALDRFGTRLEKRYTRSEITNAMVDAGLEGILFSDSPPYWCAVGLRR